MAVAHGLAVTVADVEAAASRIRGVALETPLLRSPELDELTGARVAIKAENLQRAGSFKFRGAYNRLSCLDEARRNAGVVAWSSGNHAQGVAAAARLLGINATIVMPADAPRIKVSRTRELGAEVVFYDRQTESREEIAHAIAAERGATLVPSFDDPYVIAGQGTAGLEIVAQLAAGGELPDLLLVCVGGGGLAAGIATAIKAAAPSAEIYGVEPELFDDTARSLCSGNIERVPPGATSICDALLAPAPGDLTFPINRLLLAGGLTVSDDEVRAAIRYAYMQFKLVIEPGGAVALAALLSGKVAVAGRHVTVVVSGGNIDPDDFGVIIAG